MKHIFTFLLFFSAFTFAQNTYTFKSGGRVFENNKRLNSLEVNQKFASNEAILKLYNQGRGRKTAGNLLLWTGITTVVGKFLYEANRPLEYTNPYSYGAYSDVKYSKNTLFYVGGGLILVAIPIKIGFQKKIKQSINLMNTTTNKTTSLQVETKIITNSNGVGLTFTF